MKRYRCLDMIRGLALISMVLYHALWDFLSICDYSISWFFAAPGRIWQRSICCTFILLSGFCWSLGGSKFKRGAKVFVAGLLVTAVTLIFMPENRIMFGILTLLGSCMILLIPLEKVLSKCPPEVGLPVSAAVLVLLQNLEQRRILVVELPDVLYRNIFTAYLGFPPENFFSIDYFPLLPWLPLFLAGYFLFRIMEKRDQLRHLEWGRAPALEWVGRHTLLLYLIHQPLIFAAIWILT